MNPSERKMLDDIECGERWLAGFETPPASPELVERVSRLTRAEVLRPRIRPATPAWSRLAGGLAIAAAIALAVWIGREGVEDDGATQPALQLACELEPAAADTEDDIVAIVKLNEGLDDLESWSDEGAWDPDGTSLAEALDEAYRDASNGTSG